MPETLFCLTNDDAGSQQPERFAELLDFLAEERVPATFFVVPAAGGVPLGEKPEWVDLLRRARDEGHELQHHGYAHGVFEFGVPPSFMLDIIPEARARWQREPDAVRAGHTLEILRDKLARGVEILTPLLGHGPQGFRSGCLAVSEAMEHALVEQGFRWSSNWVVNPTGWRYINGDYDAGELWGVDVPPRPFRRSVAALSGAAPLPGAAALPGAGLVEVPILSEYTWLLGPGDVERHYDLARRDYDRVRRAAGVFVALSHYYAMTGEYAAGLDVYRRLFAYARDIGDVRFCTIGQLLEERLE
jgi:peptidoglycan/xylan/chitin deacetylase (PgdA/CDA1 family)